MHIKLKSILQYKVGMYLYTTFFECFVLFLRKNVLLLKIVSISFRKKRSILKGKTFFFLVQDVTIAWDEINVTCESWCILEWQTEYPFILNVILTSPFTYIMDSFFAQKKMYLKKNNQNVLLIQINQYK